MLSKNHKFVDAGLRPGGAWLALFAIGWLQLSSAAHQFDHVAQQLNEACQICIQLDRADNAVGDFLSQTVSLYFGNELVCQSPASVSGPNIRLGFDSRAPPRI